MPNPEQEQDTDSKDENKYIAMMGYQKDDPDEVTIMEGDMVDVLQKSFSGKKHLKKMIAGIILALFMAKYGNPLLLK